MIVGAQRAPPTAKLDIANCALLVENKGIMALVVFLRGVNVGGHRTFRPSLVANELKDLDIVNVGAAGTFVVRKQVSQAKLRTEILRQLPFKAEVVICKGDDVLDLASGNPFAGQPTGPKIVRFVSILAKRGQPLLSTPLSLPSGGDRDQRRSPVSGQGVTWAVERSRCAAERARSFGGVDWGRHA